MQELFLRVNKSKKCKQCIFHRRFVLWNEYKLPKEVYSCSQRLAKYFTGNEGIKNCKFYQKIKTENKNGN